jgi:hypothetical protein
MKRKAVNMKLTEKNISDIEKIVSVANNEKTFSEACFFIVSELKKMFSDWDKKELAINYIEKEYCTKLVY